MKSTSSQVDAPAYPARVCRAESSQHVSHQRATTQRASASGADARSATSAMALRLSLSTLVLRCLLLVLLLLALLFACFLRVGGLGIRLLRITHVDTPCRIRRLLLQKEQAAFRCGCRLATAEPSGPHSSCGLRGSPFVIFDAHARGQPRLLVTTPQFVTRLIQANTVESAQRKIQLLAIEVFHECHRSAYRAKMPSRFRRTLPSLRRPGERHSTTVEHRVTAEYVAMYSPARHAMAYRHSPGSRAHAEPHRSARTPAGFFDWFAVRHHDAPLRPQSGLRATGSTSRSS
jgi:hypothetical protein